MDSFEFNKIAGAFLLALLTTIAIGYAGNALVHPTKPEKNAFAIDTSAASADAGKTVAQRQCASCHSFDKGGRNAVGPNLWNVITAQKGRNETFKYSQAMQASAKQAGDDGKWTYENVNAFLANPKAYVNGTLMAFAGLRSPQDRANLIAYLRGQADSPAALP